MTAPTREALAAQVAALTARLARVEAQLAAAQAANARLRGTPDYAASLAAGHTETLAGFEARTGRRDLGALVRGAIHQRDGQRWTARPTHDHQTERSTR
ncbi:hypothetical protein GCM10010400_76580 [Streptomyces aculeolatus]|uniref:hypothetical protein n=1 Tax=Streptomyces aculeolatus TaxID=270689 RepID=UPI001CEE07FA|nr:hypothetical protein [Streptomyces aculeolatus]